VCVFVCLFVYLYPTTCSVSGYGLTESSPVVSISEKGKTKYTSSGKPIPNTEMKVVNRENNTNLGPGKSGEICVRGPQVRHWQVTLYIFLYRLIVKKVHKVKTYMYAILLQC